MLSLAVVNRARGERTGEHKHRAAGTQEPPAELFADAAGVHVQNAHALVRQYDTIYVEELQVANMVRRPAPIPDGASGGYRHNGARAKAGLHTPIHDACWTSFLTSLAFKAASTGKRVEAVPPASTSQTCSGCGALVWKSLSVRTNVCPACGLIVDRDENAARNSQRRGSAFGDSLGCRRGEPRTRRALARAECQVWSRRRCAGRVLTELGLAYLRPSRTVLIAAELLWSSLFRDPVAARPLRRYGWWVRTASSAA
jgi:putative transposase